MDLTRLRPTASFLSSKARKQECISRSVTRLSAGSVGCTLVLANRNPGWTDPPRRLLFYLFALLSYSLHRLFAVLLPAKFAENPDKPTTWHFAAQNWSGRPSAAAPRSFQGLPSMMMFLDFALWPAFCSRSWQSKTKPLERAWKLVSVRGTYG